MIKFLMLPSWSNEAIGIVTERSRSIISLHVCNTATQHTQAEKCVSKEPTLSVCFKAKLTYLLIFRHVF